MKVALVHPLKHHAYRSFAGINKTGNKNKAFFGFYKKNDIIDRILLNTRYKSLLDGYELKSINSNVNTSIYLKILFLLYKLKPDKFELKYFTEFEKWAIKQTKSYDCIHVLQCYCNELINIAYNRGQKIIYEQITIFDSERRKRWEELSDLYNYDKSIIDKKIPIDTIDKQIQNLKMATKIIVASENVAESLDGIVPREKIHIVNYGGTRISTDKFGEINNCNENREKLKILYVGSLNLLKGIQYIIEAAKKLEDKNISFTFVGKPNTKEDNRWVEQINSLKNAMYINHIPHIEIFDLYKKNDVFIFQPECEGFGMVTLEAMSCGLPCIVSKGGRGIIRNSIDGFINENGDVDKIVENINLFYENREKIKTMGENAINSIKVNNWEKYEDEIKDIYLSTIYNEV